MDHKTTHKLKLAKSERKWSFRELLILQKKRVARDIVVITWSYHYVGYGICIAYTIWIFKRCPLSVKHEIACQLHDLIPLLFICVRNEKWVSHIESWQLKVIYIACGKYLQVLFHFNKKILFTVDINFQMNIASK